MPRAVAVVTGGAGGIGLACARELAPRFELLLGDDSTAALDRAIAALAADGVRARAVVCDVLAEDAVAALAAEASRIGRLGALVHSAGLGTATVDGARILTTNLTGTAVVLDKFAPLAGPGAAAVCIASLAGHRRRPRDFDHLLADPRAPDLVARIEAELGAAIGPRAGYELSKRGVILLCERAAAAWGERGARLVSVSPGLVDAGMGTASRRRAAVVALTALERLGTASDVARVVGFLCSDAAGYVTGTDLLVDGGAQAGMRHHAAPEIAARLDAAW